MAATGSGPTPRLSRMTVLGASSAPAGTDPAAPLNAEETDQLSRLRRWGTAGALLMAVGSTSSYGAATPVPNPVDGIRIIGLLSRVGPAALALSYSGIGLLVVCWLLIGRLAVPGRRRRLSRTQLTHTLAMWAVPFLVTPPIFSRDVYSYLAIGAQMLHGSNPYDQGPVEALGEDNPLAHQVDARWQHTTTPYGPGFLLIVKGVVAITGEHVVTGVLVQRLVELVGVAMIVWAMPRLARRCGMDPVAALWLSVLNPLLLFHLIAGGHNEALMIGAMLAGLVLALDRHLVPGVALIAVAVSIKATAGMALPFLVIIRARRKGGRWPDLFRQGALVGGIALATFLAITLIAGTGFGWIKALSTPGTVHSFLSVSTSLGVGAGRAGLLLGLGDHSQAAIDVMQPVGTAVGILIGLVIMWQSWRGRIPPILGLGISLGAFVLLGPVIQPWYLLWAALPLAAATADARYRMTTVWLTAVFAVIIMPNGGTIPVFTIVQAVVVATLVAAGVLFALWRTGLPTTVASDDTRPTR